MVDFVNLGLSDNFPSLVPVLARFVARIGIARVPARAGLTLLPARAGLTRFSAGAGLILRSSCQLQRVARSNSY